MVDVHQGIVSKRVVSFEQPHIVEQMTLLLFTIFVKLHSSIKEENRLSSISTNHNRQGSSA